MMYLVALENHIYMVWTGSLENSEKAGFSSSEHLWKIYSTPIHPIYLPIRYQLNILLETGKGKGSSEVVASTEDMVDK